MRQASDIDRDRLRPPGALLARALAAWPAERRQRLRHDLGVTAAGLDMLLLGARPPSEADIVVIGAALGVPAAVLREREETFARWAGALVPAPQPLAALGRGRDIEPLFSPREIARRVAHSRSRSATASAATC
jgi:hypothetical protein